MTATAHALVGGAIAASIPDPVIGISLAFISHPLLDMVPHWDLGWGWRNKKKSTFFLESVLDLIAGLAITFIIFAPHASSFLYFIGAIFASESWDILEGPYWFFGWKFFPFNAIYGFQHHIQGKMKLPWGIINQVLAVSLILLILRLIP